MDLSIRFNNNNGNNGTVEDKEEETAAADASFGLIELPGGVGYEIYDPTNIMEQEEGVVYYIVNQETDNNPSVDLDNLPLTSSPPSAATCDIGDGVITTDNQPNLNSSSSSSEPEEVQIIDAQLGNLVTRDSTATAQSGAEELSLDEDEEFVIQIPSNKHMSYSESKGLTNNEIITIDDDEDMQEINCEPDSEQSILEVPQESYDNHPITFPSELLSSRNPTNNTITGPTRIIIPRRMAEVIVLIKRIEIQVAEPLEVPSKSKKSKRQGINKELSPRGKKKRKLNKKNAVEEPVRRSSRAQSKTRPEDNKGKTSVPEVSPKSTTNTTEKTDSDHPIIVAVPPTPAVGNPVVTVPTPTSSSISINKSTTTKSTQCHICNKIFIRPSDRRRHERRTHIKRPVTGELTSNSVQCKLCGNILIHPKNMKNHLRRTHRLNPSQNMQKLHFVKIIHEALDGTGTIFEAACHHCNQKFYSKTDYLTHTNNNNTPSCKDKQQNSNSGDPENKESNSSSQLIPSSSSTFTNSNLLPSTNKKQRGKKGKKKKSKSSFTKKQETIINLLPLVESEPEPLPSCSKSTDNSTTGLNFPINLLSPEITISSESESEFVNISLNSTNNNNDLVTDNTTLKNNDNDNDKTEEQAPKLPKPRKRKRKIHVSALRKTLRHVKAAKTRDNEPQRSRNNGIMITNQLSLPPDGVGVFGPNAQSSECEICKKVFSNKSNMKRHQRLVHGKHNTVTVKSSSSSDIDGTKSLSPQPSSSLASKNVQSLPSTPLPSIPNNSCSTFPINLLLPDIMTLASEYMETQTAQTQPPSAALDSTNDDGNSVVIAATEEEEAPELTQRRKLNLSRLRITPNKGTTKYKARKPIIKSSIKKVGDVFFKSTAKPVQCNLCNKIFFHGGTLKKHLRTQHPSEEKKLTDVTGSNGRRRPYNQTRVYAPNAPTAKPTECEICNKFFFDAGSMRKHRRRLHSDNKFVGAAGGRPPTTKPHNFTARTAKPIECEICHTICFDSSALKKHRIRQHPEKEFDTNCSYHVYGPGAKPAQCEICKRFLYNKKSMMRHKELVHGITNTGTEMIQPPEPSSSISEGLPSSPLSPSISSNDDSTSFLLPPILSRELSIETQSHQSDSGSSSSFIDHNRSLVQNCNNDIEIDKEQPPPKLDIPGKINQNNNAPALSGQMSKKFVRISRPPKGTPIQCKVCDRSFLSFNSLKKHHISRHPEIMFDMIDEKYYTRVRVAEYATKAKPVQCEICKITVFDNYSLKRHCRRLHGGIMVDTMNVSSSFNTEEEEDTSTTSLLLLPSSPPPNMPFSSPSPESPPPQAQSQRSRRLSGFIPDANANPAAHWCDICHKSYANLAKHQLHVHNTGPSTSTAPTLYSQFESIQCQHCHMFIRCLSVAERHIRYCYQNKDKESNSSKTEPQAQNHQEETEQKQLNVQRKKGKVQKNKQKLNLKKNGAKLSKLKSSRGKPLCSKRGRKSKTQGAVAKAIPKIVSQQTIRKYEEAQSIHNKNVPQNPNLLMQQNQAEENPLVKATISDYDKEMAYLSYRSVNNEIETDSETREGGDDDDNVESKMIESFKLSDYNEENEGDGIGDGVRKRRRSARNVAKKAKMEESLIERNVNIELVEGLNSLVLQDTTNDNHENESGASATEESTDEEESEIELQEDVSMCPICDDPSIPTAQLESHIFSHQMICHICSRDDLTINTEYAAHGKTHVGPSTVCELCDYKAYSKANLWEHGNSTHFNVKPFLCKYCGDGFSSNGGMVIHQKVRHR